MSLPRSALLVAFLVLSALVSAPLAHAGEGDGTRAARLIVTGESHTGEMDEVELYRSVHALIVGIDRYESLPRSKQLKYAVRDAEGVAEILEERFEFDTITTLYNDEATKQGLLEAFYELSNTDEDDAVFVFWAGHGLTVPAARGGEDQGFLIPYDGTLEEAKLWRNVSMAELKQVVKARIKARHVFFVVDACYGGLITETRAATLGSPGDIEYLKRITRETAVQALSAGTADQEVLDGGPDGHSVFTGHFIRKLRRTDDYVTAREIGTFVERAVHHDAAERDHDQVPTFGRMLGGAGDFIFIAKERPRAVVAPAAVAAGPAPAGVPQLIHQAPGYVLLGGRIAVQVRTPSLSASCRPLLMQKGDDAWTTLTMTATGSETFEVELAPGAGVDAVVYYIEAQCDGETLQSGSREQPHRVPVY